MLNIILNLIGLVRIHEDCVTLDPGPAYDVELVVLTVPSRVSTPLPLAEIET